MIDLTNFVKINIKYASAPTIVGTREVVALLCPSTISEAKYSSYAALALVITDTTVLAYAKVFFDEGGKTLHVYPYTDTMPAIPDDEVVIAATNANVVTLADAYQSVDGIHKKIFVGHTDATTALTSKFGVALKYVKTADIAKGYEMAIAAYLSRIDAYGNGTVEDYCYTEEAIPAATDDNAVFTAAMDANLNINIELAGKLLNVGGNTIDGNPVVNEFMLIVLQQTCTDRLINALTQKLKGVKGVASVKSVLENELVSYVTDGYLSTEKHWTDDDLTVTYNNATYTIIKKGTVIDKGYVVYALPYASLTAADITAHKVPPVYLVIADMYSIRTIEVDGEVK